MKRKKAKNTRFERWLVLVAAHLQQAFEARYKQFPTEALWRLQELIPETESLIGVRAPFKKKSDVQDERLELDAAHGRLARHLRRYKLLFGAKIPTDLGGRAALYYKTGCGSPGRRPPASGTDWG